MSFVERKMPGFVHAEQHDPKRFALNCMLSALAALILGGAIDNAFKAFGDVVPEEKRGWAALLFFIQLIANILFLLAITCFWSSFLYWIQLSISGMIFSVLFFVVQEELARNALTLTSWA